MYDVIIKSCDNQLLNTYMLHVVCVIYICVCIFVWKIEIVIHWSQTVYSLHVLIRRFLKRITEYFQKKFVYIISNNIHNIHLIL